MNENNNETNEELSIRLIKKWSKTGLFDGTSSNFNFKDKKDLVFIEPFTSDDAARIKKRSNTGLFDELDNHIEKPHMEELWYSPPYMPVDEELRKIWNTLLSVGIVEIKLVERNGKLGIMTDRDQTITLEKDKFYPIEETGGDIQQKAIYPYLKNG